MMTAFESLCPVPESSTDIHRMWEARCQERAELNPTLLRADRKFLPVLLKKAELDRLDEEIWNIHSAHLRLLKSIDKLDPFPRAYLNALRCLYASADTWGFSDPSQLLPPELLRQKDFALYGRPDMVLTTTGPKIVETNFESGIGGYENAGDLFEMAKHILGIDGRYAGNPLSALAGIYDRVADMGHPDIIWISTPSSNRQRMFDDMITRINRYARHSRVHVAHPGGPLRTAFPVTSDRPLLFRSVSLHTVLSSRTDYASLFAQLFRICPNTLLANADGILSSKLMLALCSEFADLGEILVPSEIEAIRRLVPWTRIVGLLNDHDRQRLIKERHRYVLKRADSYRGKHVHFGRDLDAGEWAMLIEEKEKIIQGGHVHMDDSGLPDVWIAQEFIQPAGIEVMEIKPTGITRRKTELCCSPFVIHGRIGAILLWTFPKSSKAGTGEGTAFVPVFFQRDERTETKIEREVNNAAI